MQLEIRPSNRWCVVEHRRTSDLPAIRADILRQQGVCGDFTLTGTPAPARDQTPFKVFTDGRELLVAVALLESVAPSLRHASYHMEPLPNRNTIELFFAPWNDRLGWFQFCFPPDGTVQTFTHLPYPEAHSTAFEHLRVKRHRWEIDKQSVSHRMYWFFAWFSVAAIFKQGTVCGFNVVRHVPPIEESSSWNPASAVGVQDATCFGRLHLKQPVELNDVRAALSGNKLAITAPAAKGALRLELLDPTDKRHPIRVRRMGAQWLGVATLPGKLAGRYRIVASSGNAAIEPEYLSFDVASVEHARQFRFSLTYDIPDNIAYTNHYTPKRMERELGVWKSWGINRLYWIEYGPLSTWPSFWKMMIGSRNRFELSGLSVNTPFVAIEIKGKTFPMTHRRFAFAEAWGTNESEAPLSPATSGDRSSGFRFDKTWLGWANQNEPIVDPYTWNGPEFGLTFREADHAPTLLEPAYEGSRGIWLSHLDRILKTEVDGVEIRTIGHHNCVPSYLRLAFAEPVRTEFRRRFGRDARTIPEDYERVRRIRGEAYTQFMRDARALADRYGKKLCAHIEWGADVPPHRDSRLQMQMAVEWERWIRERTVDEVSLRGWMCENPYVHQRLLPLARRMGVGVHIITKNLPGGMDLRAMELCERFVTEACAAGFSGFNLYEADNLLRMNGEGIPMGVGNIEQAVRKAAASLAKMAHA